MDQNEREKIVREMAEFFENGRIHDISEEDLKRYLAVVCSSSSGAVHDLSIAVTRCSVLTTERLFRYIDRLDKSNRRLSGWIITLAVLTLIAQIAQLLRK
jgi:hypothetical protein